MGPGVLIVINFFDNYIFFYRIIRKIKLFLQNLTWNGKMKYINGCTIFLLIVASSMQSAAMQVAKHKMRLLTAIRIGTIEDVKTLLSQGANINEQNDYGNAPLHVAVLTGNISMVKVLLDAGADVTLSNKDNRWPIDIARKELQQEHRWPPFGTPIEYQAIIDALKRKRQEQCPPSFFELFFKLLPKRCISQIANKFSDKDLSHLVCTSSRLNDLLRDELIERKRPINYWSQPLFYEQLPHENGNELYGAVAFSHDGKQLAAVSEQRICLYDLTTLQPVKSFAKSLQNWYYPFAFHPDGQTIASVGSDDCRKICLWNVKTNEQKVFVGHADEITAVEFSPNGNLLASASLDGTVRLWDVKTGTILRTWTGPIMYQKGVHNPNIWIYSVAFSPDATMVTAGISDKIYVWNITQDNAVQILATQAPKKHGHISSVAFSPDGQTLAAAATYSRALYLWDTKNWFQKPQILCASKIKSIAFTPDSRIVATAPQQSEDLAKSRGPIQLWHVMTGKHLNKIKVISLYGHCKIAFSPDGLTFATCSNRKVCLRSPATDDQIQKTIANIVDLIIKTQNNWSIAVDPQCCKNQLLLQDEILKITWTALTDDQWKRALINYNPPDGLKSIILQIAKSL